MTVVVFPLSRVVDEPVARLEGRGLELSTGVIVVVVDELVVVLVRNIMGLELEGTVTVIPPDSMLEDTVEVNPVAVLGGGGMELEVVVVVVGGATGGMIGDVVFRAGHPEGPISRRNGQ